MFKRDQHWKEGEGGRMCSIARLAPENVSYQLMCLGLCTSASLSPSCGLPSAGIESGGSFYRWVRFWGSKQLTCSLIAWQQALPWKGSGQHTFIRTACGLQCLWPNMRSRALYSYDYRQFKDPTIGSLPHITIINLFLCQYKHETIFEGKKIKLWNYTVVR